MQIAYRCHILEWYGIEFNVPLDTVMVISETTTLSSDVHLPSSNAFVYNGPKGMELAPNPHYSGGS